VRGQLHAPTALPIGQDVGWTPDPVWTIWRSEKLMTLPGLECRFLGRPARSQSLYRTLYIEMSIETVGFRVMLSKRFVAVIICVYFGRKEENLRSLHRLDE
jgi:hypothetical protein